MAHRRPCACSGFVVAALWAARRSRSRGSASFAVLGVVGLWDFWHWEYEYGHDLDFEHAIIKVPGMTYQPPLIGSKQLLNFTASSWPAIGSLLIGVAFVLGVASLVVAARARRPASDGTHRGAPPGLEGAA